MAKSNSQLAKELADSMTASVSISGLNNQNDTITLSSSGYNYANTSITGGGYTYSNAITNNGAVTGNLGPYVVSAGTGITNPWAKYPSGKIKLEGNDADIELNGRSLIKLLDRIEERLNMLTPNPELETEWDQLRELGEQYRALEAKLTEQGKMWAKLKAMPPPEID